MTSAQIKGLVTALAVFIGSAALYLPEKYATVALAISAGLLGAVHVKRPGDVSAVLVLLLLLGLPQGCASWKPVARTVDGIAESLCAQFFSEQKPGLSLEEAANQFCATHEDLSPWIDQILAAKQAAGRAALAGSGGVP